MIGPVLVATERGGILAIMPTEYRHALPRFSLKRMLLSTTLIAVGLVAICLLFRAPQRFNEATEVLLWFLGGALVGAGIFAPFDKARNGALVGLAVQGMIYGVIVSYQLSLE